MLLTRAAPMIQIIQTELKKHQKALEVDDSVSKITLEIIMGKRNGDPVKIRYLTSSESDLTQTGSRHA